MSQLSRASLPSMASTFLPLSACLGSIIRTSAPPSLITRVLCLAITSLEPRTNGSLSTFLGAAPPFRTASRALRNASGSEPNSSRSFFRFPDAAGASVGAASDKLGMDLFVGVSPRASSASSMLSYARRVYPSAYAMPPFAALILPERVIMLSPACVVYSMIVGNERLPRSKPEMDLAFSSGTPLEIIVSYCFSAALSAPPVSGFSSLLSRPLRASARASSKFISPRLTRMSVVVV